MAILWYSQDHLQLPPVPESSSMLAPLEGTSDEHKVGAKIFRNAELVFQFNTAMRFTDETLIQILDAMRKPGGSKLSHDQWQALLKTDRSAEQPATPSHLKILSICDVQRWLAEESIASCSSADGQRLREAVAVLSRSKTRQEDLKPLQPKWQVSQKQGKKARPLADMIQEFQVKIIKAAQELQQQLADASAGSRSSGSAARPAHPAPATATTTHSDSVERPGQSPPTWRFLLCFTQMWIHKSGQAFPPFARTVLEYLDKNIHHPHQLSLAQFCAYHLREVIFNLDMLAIAPTKLTATEKEKVEDETVERGNAASSHVETEFYGGENTDEPENEDIDEGMWRPMCSLSHARLTAILARHAEVAAAHKPGRKSAAVMQMKIFDDCFHTWLKSPCT